MKFIKKRGTEIVPSKNYTPGTSGYAQTSTFRNTDTLVVEYTFIGTHFLSYATGTGGKKYSYFINSFAYLSTSEAGTWNFAMRTTNDNFCSMYILEGNYAWDDKIAYHNDTITFGTNSSPWE